MNARQRRGLRRKWSKLLGECLDLEDALHADAVARFTEHVIRAKAAGNVGRLVQCGCAAQLFEQSCYTCGDQGELYSSQWKLDIATSDPIAAAYNDVIGSPNDPAEVPF